MPESDLHVEPFVHLVDLSHDSALIAWGAFYFHRTSPGGRWEILDDSELPDRTGRHTSIGHDAEPFGDATVRVYDAHGGVVAEARTAERSWVWVRGLAPTTTYTYRITVDGADWAAGERWDWVETTRGGYDLAPAGRRYDLRFTTFPSPHSATPRVRFAALGDYGVGIRSDSESSRRQRRVADVLDHLLDRLDLRFVVSLGDNIYQGEQGDVDDESGGEDDDWYSSFFMPYRYVLARIPVFPTIGNHDTTDSEGSDDRAQMDDNFHLAARFDGEGRSRCGPGLFYTVAYGRDLQLVCIDTSQDADDERAHRYFQAPEQSRWLADAFSGRDVRWRIPFSHHPMYCAGPSHEDDAEAIDALLPLYDNADVRLVLAGHEHNFQIGTHGGRTYVISGSGGKVREERPARLGQPGVQAWAAHSHLLVVEIDGERASLTPVTGLLADGSPHLMTAQTRDRALLEPPFVVQI